MHDSVMDKIHSINTGGNQIGQAMQLDSCIRQCNSQVKSVKAIQSVSICVHTHLRLHSWQTMASVSATADC